MIKYASPWVEVTNRTFKNCNPECFVFILEAQKIISGNGIEKSSNKREH